MTWGTSTSPRPRGSGESHRAGEPCWCVPLMVSRAHENKTSVCGTRPNGRDVEASNAQARSGANIP